MRADARRRRRRGTIRSRATSRGVGELIAAAVAEGAERIVVFVGGVASTDGGVGATEAVPHPLRVPLEVACDVDARFLDAADVFAPQKGATPEQVRDPARASREARRPRSARVPARRAGSPEGSRRSARGSSPASTSSPTASGSTSASRRRISSSPARGSSTRPPSPARSSAAFSHAPRRRASRRSSSPETSRPAARSTPLSLVASYGQERALAEPAECLTELVETTLAARRN